MGSDRGASPSTRAMPGLVPSPPLIAMYGPASRTGPAARKATARHHRGQLIRVARSIGSSKSVSKTAAGKSIPSGRVK